MTKEELKQEAEAEADKVIIGRGMDRTSVIHLKHLLATMYIQGAELREKQIEIDAEQIRALQKQNGELTDKVKELEQELIEADNATDVFNAQEKRIAELEAQIEKMKCCENCAWWYKLPNGQRDCAETCENLDNWSLRR